ncbi:glycogen debranching protein GlgX [Archangium violaceum]|uniref:glycogen debranching protein GlgX n=1 Tax=Archangium violaceum TaxID=83451 RepID=UPI00194DB99B|nr:glycogen debranching protein GlgX [Archangium violaceum]QRN95356.1 glycogen debranching protein GlgX [Archangium violaceum]
MMSPQRIDNQPQRTHGSFRLRAGRPLPFGATLVPGGVNFSVFSRRATAATLVLFEKGSAEPLAEIPFPREFRIGDVFAMTVYDLDIERIEYGYRMDGPFDPASGQRFDPRMVLMDPYAKAISGRNVWGEPPDWNRPFQYRSCLVPEDFDWEDDRPLEIPLEDSIIYETHVRGFTRHPSSGVRHPGTFAGLMEKLPYLRELGVNCIELMPIFEFDEFDNSRTHPGTGERLLNCWGYNTVGFFAPKAGYAATGRFGMQVDELKTLVKELHRQGIEVILDVVYNHTAEGNEHGPTISYRGLDNSTYYMLTPEGYYFNFSGVGNTVNCNDPVVRDMVLDSLRYWVSEFHIDGFRFDLAAILGRDPSGRPLSNPPLLEALAFDPILGKCKLIAEAWDAGGLYQVGSFPAYGRWAEWNGKYRDTLRKFLRSDSGQLGELSQCLQGSPNLYGWNGRGPTASINFITCHDGFTLHDLVSYDHKHNEANGEDNRDGSDDNLSWNSGAEGDTDDPHIQALRLRRMKSAVALLMVSQGVPMLLAGDEVGRSQAGNNNNYCNDNELSWFDWSLVESRSGLLRFVKNCIAFRKQHPVLRSARHPRNSDFLGLGSSDISWHGTRAWFADWSPESRLLAFMLDGRYARDGQMPDDSLYVVMNGHWEPLTVELPAPPAGGSWHVFANTGADAPDDSYEPGTEPRLPEQRELLVGARSVVILVSR